MTPTDARRPTSEKCPHCDVRVRRDRLLTHVARVHPGQSLEPETVKRIRKASREASRGSRTPRAPLPRRWIFAGVGVVIVVLVAYVILHSSASGLARTGGAAPDFTFTGLSGNSHSLSSYKGHPLVLWWVATFCSGCSEGTSYFAQNYYSQYHTEGVTLLEIEDYNDLGQPGPSMSSFATSNGYNGQAGWVMGIGSASGTQSYNPNGYLDVYYVINAQGNIVSSGQVLSSSFSTALQQAVSS